MVQTNIIAIVMRLIERSTGNRKETLEIMSGLGLDPADSHRRGLLRWCMQMLYYWVVVENPNQRLLETPAHMPNKDEPVKLSKARTFSMECVTVDAGDWLARKGYVLIDKKDLGGISSRTSFEKMADIYWKIHEKLGAMESWVPEVDGKECYFPSTF